MVDFNTTTLNALTMSLRKEFQEGLQHTPPTWQQIAMRIPSSTATNVYSWLGSMPMMKEWVGAREIKTINEEGFYLANKLFEGTIGIPRTAFEDDQIGNYRITARQLGVAASKLPDQLVWPLLADGLNNKCIDGQSYFDIEHPLYANHDGTGDVSFQSNLTMGNVSDAPTWYVIDDSNVIKPIIWQERIAPTIETKFTSAESDHVFMMDQVLYGARARGNAGYGFWQLAHAAVKTPLTGENLDAVIEKMKTLKANGGQTLSVNPTKIIVPPKLETTAKQLLEAEIINGTSNTRADTLKIHVESSLS